MKKNNRFLYLSFFIVFSLIILSCGYKETSDKPEPLKHKVTVISIEKTKTIPQIKSFGTLSFYKKADVSSAVEGTVRSIYCMEGDPVKSGQLMAVIENIQLDIRKKQAASTVESAESALELAEAILREGKLQVSARFLSIEKSEIELLQKGYELSETEKILKNKEELFKIGGLSEESINSIFMKYHAVKTDYLSSQKDIEIEKIGLRDIDIINQGYSVPYDKEIKNNILSDINTQTLKAKVRVAESNLYSARTELSSAEQLINELKINSPFSGVVGARYLEQGERLSAGDKIFTVFDISSVYAVFPVQEHEALLISRGQDAEITLDSFPQRVFKGKVDIISPMADPQTGNLTVKALITDTEPGFKPGMFLRVKVTHSKPRNAIFIPVSAVAQRKNNKGNIFTVVNKHIFRKTVSLGEENEGNIEVLEGLNPGETVVDSPCPVLKEGEEVEI